MAETDQEQIEELKKWWHENGRTVVAGLVLGLGGVFGWTTWQSYQASQAELSSRLYTQIVNSAASENHAQAIHQTDALIEEFPDSAYAALSALVGARSAHASANPDDAQRLLQWTVDNAGEPEIADVARLRLARLQLDAGQHDAALRSIDAVTSEGFRGVAGEIRGDVLLARGDPEAARREYETVLERDDLPSSMRLRVRMKLDDLGQRLVP